MVLFESIVNRMATPLHHLVDTILWMDVRYNFMYIFMTISGAIFLSGESNLMSDLLKMF